MDDGSDLTRRSGHRQQLTTAGTSSTGTSSAETSSGGDPADATIPRRTLWSYAAGSVGTGGFGTLPGLVLAYYLTDTLSVAAGAAAVIVVAPKIIDLVVNPVVGARSDAHARATGSRRGYMIAGALMMLPLFILTFATPTSLPVPAAAVWVLVFFTLTAIAYAFFQVPYVALPADLTTDYHERTRLLSVRIAVLALAILVVGAGAPAIRDAAGGGAGGYLLMAIAAAILICAGMLVASRCAPSRGARTQTHDHVGADGRAVLREGITAFREINDFRILLAVFVLQALASAVMLGGAQYVATYVLDDTSALTPMFAALVAPAILVMPLWYRFARRHGKVVGLFAASATFTVAAASLVIAVWAPGPWMFASVAVAGVGYAGMQAFPLAMLPDLISGDAQQSGIDRSGAISGVWTAGETVGLALGPGVFLLVLAACGFVSSSGDHTATQSSTAITGIAVGFSLIPALLVAASMLVLRRYRDTTVRHDSTKQML